MSTNSVNSATSIKNETKDNARYVIDDFQHRFKITTYYFFFTKESIRLLFLSIMLFYIFQIGSKEYSFLLSFTTYLGLVYFYYTNYCNLIFSDKEKIFIFALWIDFMNLARSTEEKIEIEGDYAKYDVLLLMFVVGYFLKLII